MNQSELESEISKIVVSSLQLEDIRPEDIKPEVPLFGEGLGLDSIDALELASALEKRFGVKFSQATADMNQVFRSVRTLAAYIGERSN